MPKILAIDIEKGMVSVGLDNGTAKDFPIDQFSFKPVVNAKIDIFKKEDGSYVISSAKSNQQLMDTKSHKVSKIVYLVVTLFLGGLGIHKFIAGRIGLGILYLVFCWTFIPEIVALIEFIMACFKEADADGMIEC